MPSKQKKLGTEQNKKERKGNKHKKEKKKVIKGIPICSTDTNFPRA